MSLAAKVQRVTDESGLRVLLEMSASSLGAPLRLVNDTQDCVSNGHTYVGFPFRFKLADDAAGQPPRALLEIDNVGREITADLENLPPNEILSATIIVVDGGDPDIVYQSIPMPVTHVSLSPTLATAQCGPDYIMRQAAVKLVYNPFTTPGIF